MITTKDIKMKIRLINWIKCKMSIKEEISVIWSRLLLISRSAMTIILSFISSIPMKTVVQRITIGIGVIHIFKISFWAIKSRWITCLCWKIGKSRIKIHLRLRSHRIARIIRKIIIWITLRVRRIALHWRLPLKKRHSCRKIPSHEIVSHHILMHGCRISHLWTTIHPIQLLAIIKIARSLTIRSPFIWKILLSLTQSVFLINVFFRFILGFGALNISTNLIFINFILARISILGRQPFLIFISIAIIASWMFLIFDDSHLISCI